MKEPAGTGTISNVIFVSGIVSVYRSSVAAVVGDVL
jgi:hypothetical protein